jgi:hypothetical protein
MRERRKVSLAARSTRACLLAAIALCILIATARADERKHSSNTPVASPTPTATSGALKPIVLIAGGTGYVELPTGKSPGVLNSAEIYDPALRRFLPIAPMNERRDQFTAAAIA